MVASTFSTPPPPPFSNALLHVCFGHLTQPQAVSSMQNETQCCQSLYAYCENEFSKQLRNSTDWSHNLYSYTEIRSSMRFSMIGRADDNVAMHAFRRTQHTQTHTSCTHNTPFPAPHTIQPKKHHKQLKASHRQQTQSDTEKHRDRKTENQTEERQTEPQNKLQKSCTHSIFRREKRSLKVLPETSGLKSGPAPNTLQKKCVKKLHSIRKIKGSNFDTSCPVATQEGSR